MFARGGEEQPKRPMSAYMLWMNDNRNAIKKKLGDTAKIGDIAKEAGAQWKKLTAAKKKPFEKKAVEAKAAYEKALEKFKANGGVVMTKSKKTKKASAPKDPNMPKRPPTAYFIFLNENRDDIIKALPEGYKYTDVAVDAGKRWRAMSAAQKKPYEKKNAKLKKEYEKAMADYAK